jgi:hypothetical protein
MRRIAAARAVAVCSLSATWTSDQPGDLDLQRSLGASR